MRNAFVACSLFLAAGLGLVGGPYRLAAAVRECDSRFVPVGVKGGGLFDPNNPDVCAVAVDGDCLYIGGDFTNVGGVAANGIARWNGRAWEALGDGVDGLVYDILADGSNIYACGYFEEAGGTTVNSIARWDGAHWSALGSGLEPPAPGIAQPTSMVKWKGDLYVCGADVYYADGLPVSGIARWDGAAWSLMATNCFGVNGFPRVLAVMDEDLVVGGNFDGGFTTETVGPTVPLNHIGRWDGSQWHALAQGAVTGVNDQVYHLATEGTDLYVAGLFSTAGGVPASRIARWDGTSWTALGDGLDDEILALTVHAGEVFAGGKFDHSGSNAVHRLGRWDGAAWHDGGGRDADEGGWVKALASYRGRLFVGNIESARDQPLGRAALYTAGGWKSLGGANGTVHAAAWFDGKLYLGGEFSQIGGTSVNHVACWDGVSWSPLGSGVNDTVYALEPCGDGLCIGGAFSTAGGSPASRIAVWNGSEWSTFGTGLDNTVYAIAVAGRWVYAAGDFTAAGGGGASCVARWSGASWSAMGSGIGGAAPSVRALCLAPPYLYLGGYFDTAGGVAVTNIARFQIGMSHWEGLSGGGPNGRVYALAARTDSSGLHLYAAGAFTQIGAKAPNRIAEWTGAQGWRLLGDGTTNGLDFTAYALCNSGPDLLAGGIFLSAGGQSASRLAAWDGNGWRSLSDDAYSGVNGAVRSIAACDGFVFAGGEFTAPESVADRVARFTQAEFTPLTGGCLTNVYALAVRNRNVYVGGEWDVAPVMPAASLARWNGERWRSLNTHPHGHLTNGRIDALLARGEALYAAGNWSVPLWQWRHGFWSTVGYDINASVHALAAEGADLYVGGSFTVGYDYSYAGQALGYIGMWDGLLWRPLGDAISNGVNDTVWTVLTSGTNVYVGGTFTRAYNGDGDAVAVNRVARWDGAGWHALGAGVNGPVYALATDGTCLYVGGSFTDAGSGEANGIACWNGSTWSPMSAGLNGPVYAVECLGSNVYVTGTFTLAGLGQARYVARWDGAQWDEVNGGLDAPGCALARDTGVLYVGGDFLGTGSGGASYRLARLFDDTSDCDGDGIPDRWEIETTGGYVYCNPFEDQDADTFLGIDEYIADTCPFDASSRFGITGADPVGPVNRVQCASSSNRWYRLRRTASLRGTPVWGAVGSGTKGSGGDLWLSDTNSDPSAFYRAEVGLQPF